MFIDSKSSWKIIEVGEGENTENIKNRKKKEKKKSGEKKKKRGKTEAKKKKKRLKEWTKQRVNTKIMILKIDTERKEKREEM